MLNSVLWILSLVHRNTSLIYIPPLHYILWLLPTIEGTNTQIKEFSWVARACLNYDLFVKLFFNKGDIFEANQLFMKFPKILKILKTLKCEGYRDPLYIIISVLLKHYKITTNHRIRTSGKSPEGSPKSNSWFCVQELHHLPESIGQRLLELCQPWSCDHFPGQPVPVPNHPPFLYLIYRFPDTASGHSLKTHHWSQQWQNQCLPLHLPSWDHNKVSPSVSSRLNKPSVHRFSHREDQTLHYLCGPSGCSLTALCLSYIVALKTAHRTRGEASLPQGRVGQSLPSTGWWFCTWWSHTKAWKSQSPSLTLNIS